MNKEKDWARVVLYGTFDGFTYSTDGLPKTAVILDGGEKVEVPDEYVLMADKILREDEIKLKDVIKRIEKFDIGTKAVWINEILYKLGSDYGLHKYYEGYKQGELEGAMKREKVTIPQFVADWIEEGRKHCKDVSDLFGFDFTNEEVGKWFLQEKPFDLVARAWLDGYEVEKEKRYLVKVKGVGSVSFLNHDIQSDLWSINDENNSVIFKTHHTRKELEQAGFGWVLDCEGVEVEEVE